VLLPSPLGAVCLCVGTSGGALTWLPVAGLMLRRSERASFTAVATAVTADTSKSDADRSRRIGQINMVFCLGFTLGSSTSGKIGDFARTVPMAPERLVAAAAVLVGLLTLFTVAVLLPIPAVSTPDGAKTRASSSSVTSAGVTAPPPMVWDRMILGLLLVRMLVGGGFFLMTGTFDLYCRDRFGLHGGDYGRFLAFAGCCWAAVNGAVVPVLFKRFVGEREATAAAAMEQRLLAGALLSLGISRIAYTYCDVVGLPGLFIVEFW